VGDSLNTPDPTFSPKITPLNTSDAHTVLLFVVLIVFFNLLFVLITVAQARAQGNRAWWLWGLISLAAPFVGYLIWRVFGASDDGSPGQLLPM